MQSTPNEKSSVHLGYLDAARGIAALSVMAYHFINWRYEDKFAAKLGSIVFNGSDAVSFFFVLSGFVLSWQYVAGEKKLSVSRFYIARWFRLWPAFFVVVAANALNWMRSNITLHQLADVFLRNKTHFWNEALLLRSYPQYFIPGWTLVVELSVSLMVPFLIVLARTSPRLLMWLAAAVLIIGGNMGDFFMFHFHFILGVLLSCWYGQLRSASFRDTVWYRRRYLLLAGAMVLYSVRHISRIHEFPASYTAIAKYLRVDFFHYTALASFVFIVCMIVSGRLQRILQRPVLLFFGRISYGVYLCHWLLVTDIFIYWDKIRAMFPSSLAALCGTFVVYSATTILLATLLHYFIELPFIRLGRRIASRVAPGVEVGGARG